MQTETNTSLTYSILEVLNKIVKVLSSTFFGVMTVVIFMQIIWRYVLLKPIPWAEELARYLFVWITYLGASVAVLEKSHTGVELFTSLLPKRMRRIASIVSYICCIFFVALVGYYSWTLAMKVTKQRSPAIQISMFLPYLAIPLSSVLMFINFIVLITEEFREILNS